MSRLLTIVTLASLIGFATPALAQFSAPDNPYTANPYSAPPTSAFPMSSPIGLQSPFPAQPAYQQPGVAVSPGGVPMGAVVPMGGGNSVIVSPDGQVIGVSQ